MDTIQFPMFGTVLRQKKGFSYNQDLIDDGIALSNADSRRVANEKHKKYTKSGMKYLGSFEYDNFVEYKYEIKNIKQMDIYQEKVK